MNACAFCKRILTLSDIDRGQCPACYHVIAQGPAPPAAPSGLEARNAQTIEDTGPITADTHDGLSKADELRNAQTPTADKAMQPQAQHEPGPANEQRSAETHQAIEPPGPEPQRETGTADEQRIAHTIQSASAAESVRPVPIDGPRGQPVIADAGRYEPTLVAGGIPSSPPSKSLTERNLGIFAQTIEGGEYHPDLIQHMSLVWSGTLDSNASPQTSIKSESVSSEKESRLVIQPRAIHDGKEPGAPEADYELLRQLGEGGMGVVMAARQASIDRVVAIKKIKPSEATKPESRQKFLAEAIVTGDLEHPNIVPIYDLGKDRSGTLFYAMKHVKGTPWERVIAEKNLQENLEIWMKAADAVAFAHSRGIIHRDLKPENVMLGGFGEVLVMDWGLALAVGSAAARSGGMAGTPAYMAPEMAVGPIESVGFASDIYLLGAILYEIVTGKKAHTGSTITACLLAAAKNEIQPTDRSGELVDIALKAMAANPSDRYATVGDMQEAYRQYCSHVDSISLSGRAEADLKLARTRQDYECYARALFGFQEALELWDGNARAKQAIAETSLAYAEQAYRNGDFDLGARLLDAGNAAHSSVLQQIRLAQNERDTRAQRLKTARRVGAALVVAIFGVVTIAFFLVNHQRKIAEEARNEALEQKNEAIKQKGIAEGQKKEAVQQRGRAEGQTKIATAASIKEEYGGYIARIGLAAAKIEENAFDHAEMLLNECPRKLRNWEWGRLKYLCAQGSRTVNAIDPVEALAFSPDGTRFASGGWGGTVRIWEVASRTMIRAIPTGGDYVFALAFSPDGRRLATGGNSKPDYIKIWDAGTGKLEQTLRGHRDAVLALAYSEDGRELLSGSYDNTARIWDVAQSRELRLLRGHEWWVCSAAFSSDERQVVTACQDGSVMVWDISDLKTDHRLRTVAPKLTFLGHTGPVYTVAFLPGDAWIASAGFDKRLLLWKPLPDSKDSAIKIKCDSILVGHTAPVHTLQFSEDGELLVTGGHDNTVRVWDLPNRKLKTTLRGHAGRVRAVAVSPHGRSPTRDQKPRPKLQLISGGHDGHVKIWDIQGYREELVMAADIVRAHEDSILGASFSPDGQSIISASRDRTARLWSRNSGKPLGEFQQGHHYLATTAFFFPDGSKFVTVAVDNSARIWDVSTGLQIQSMEGTGLSAAAAISRDGSRIATGSDHHAARIWDANGNSIAETPDHHAAVTAVAFSPDGRLLFTGDELGHCRLWDASTIKLLWQAHKHTRAVKSACFLSDGKRILTASNDRTVAQWETESGTEITRLTLGHASALTSLAVSPSGRQVLTTCEDGRARLWDVVAARKLGEFGVPGEAISAVAISPDGLTAVTTSTKSLEVTTSSAGSRHSDALAGPAESWVRLWDLKTLAQLPSKDGRPAPIWTFREASALAWATIYSPDGNSLVTVIGNEARMFNIKARHETMAFIPQGAVASARFSPDGKRAITASWDNTARIWNIDGPQAEVKLVGHAGYVNDAVFSPGQGRYVATAGRDSQAILWDASTGKLITRFGGSDGHHGSVSSVAFDPTGRRLVTASQDRTAKIWDVETGKVLVTLGGSKMPFGTAVAGRIHPHEQTVLCAVFSPDGQRVLTAGDDNRAILWHAATGMPLLQFQGHTAAVTSICFSPDGMRAITGSRDTVAKIWELREEDGKTDGKELLTLKGHSQDVATVACSNDGQSVLTGSLDGTMILWPASPWEMAPVKAQIGDLTVRNGFLSR
jgi:WD40 repeat protein